MGGGGGGGREAGAKSPIQIPCCIDNASIYSNRTIDTIPYDTGLETPLCACSLLVVPEVLKRH